MTLESTYTYTCDSSDCGKVAPPMKSNYYLPEGWSNLSVKADGKVHTNDRTLHFCPKCTGAIMDGFLKSVDQEDN